MSKEQFGSWSHQLIQGEFRPSFEKRRPPEPFELLNTSGVVVLSQREFVLMDDGHGEKIDWDHPDNLENFVRIEQGIDILNIIAIRKTGAYDTTWENEDAIEAAIADGPPLILTGTPTQLPHMIKIAQELGLAVHPDKIVAIDCTIDGVAHTGTQFQALAKHFGEQPPAHLTVVSNDYHLPRVARTAAQHLPPTTKFSLAPAHDDPPETDDQKRERFRQNFRRVRGEVKRIIRYSNLGSIHRDAPLNLV